jgi:hypothetical protein
MKTQHTIASIIESGHDEENAPAVLALCQHLDCTPDSVSLERHDHYGLPVYSAPGGAYAVGTDEQAQQATEENIKDSVWAFNASFILSECGLPSELEKAIRSFQEKECENANDALLTLVEKCVSANQGGAQKGLPAFAENAISADGRGRFLSSYDGKEREETIHTPEGDEETCPALKAFWYASNGKQSLTFYIYRTN